MPKILVVDDDESTVELLIGALSSSGYSVTGCPTAACARSVVTTLRPDLILLELALPDMDGLILIGDLARLTSAPIVVLSARTTQRDRVLSLKLGGADFVSKPPDLDELEARIANIVRRTMPPDKEPKIIIMGGLEINLRGMAVTLHGQLVRLTPIEYRLLVAMAQARGATVTRDELIATIYGYTDPDYALTAAVKVHVNRLRTRLKHACGGAGNIIRTTSVPSPGYSIKIQG